MTGWLLRRCLWMVPTLIGITFVTFLALDLAPVDRGSYELAKRTEPSVMNADERAVALARLRIRYGLVDPETLEPVPVWTRYGRWLGNAVQLRLAGADEDQAAFRGRLSAALPVTMLLGFWSTLLAFAIGAPLGAWLGLRRGTGADRAVSWALFVAIGLPEVLLATLLLLTFGAAGLGWLPTMGLRTDGSESWTVLQQLGDLFAHMVLPVCAMAIGPLVTVARFTRESVGRAAASAFARNLDAWGIEPAIRRRRLLRVGFAPIATMIGSFLPDLVIGSIVVESIFSIHGVGRLFWQAVLHHDQAMVMASTLIVAIVTLVALLLSDLAHQLLDPRVRLQQ